VTCTNPINNPGSSGGSTVDGGGVDPNCVGTYDLCANIGGKDECTKSCTYPGGTGPKADPTDCPSPPTSGTCTPRGFCQ